MPNARNQTACKKGHWHAQHMQVDMYETAHSTLTHTRVAPRYMAAQALAT
jgi:hypothetical protein